MSNKTLRFNRRRVGELQAAYDQAVENNLETFTFQGEELLTAYAKYMLQFLNSRQFMQQGVSDEQRG